MSLEVTNRWNNNSQASDTAFPKVANSAYPENVKVTNAALKAFESISNFFYQHIHKMLGYVVLISQNSRLFRSAEIEFEKSSLRNDFKGEEIKFQTPDGLSLDGMYFKSPFNQKSERTIIFFNGNGIRYEQYACGDLFDINAWKGSGWNVVIFNYRGVGHSEGVATRDGLILDGEAVLQHVRDQFKVPENKILLHGHSFGGAIASEVAVRHPDVNYCNDRSFSSLSNQVKVMLGNGIVGSIASKILTYFGWEYHVRNNWDKIKGKKMAVYHEKDGAIPEGARFHESLDNHAIKIKMENACLPPLNTTKQEARQVGLVNHLRMYDGENKELYFQSINTI